MKGEIKFVGKSLNTSEVREDIRYSSATKTPERKADVFDNDYEKKGFERGIDGLFKIKRVNLDKLLGEDVSDVKENSNIDGNTSAADAGGVDKDIDKKQVAFIRTYEKRQKARTPEIGK